MLKSNVEGTSVCARAAAAEMTRSDVVADIRHAGRHIDARYAGNRGARQAFFSIFFERFESAKISSAED